MQVEYRVRPVTRYIVTRFHDDAKRGSGVETKGEYANEAVAHEVAYALAKHEHEALGYPIDDMRIKYPERATEKLWTADKAREFLPLPHDMPDDWVVLISSDGRWRAREPAAALDSA